MEAPQGLFDFMARAGLGRAEKNQKAGCAVSGSNLIE
jgi:hypothetical protein